MGANQQLLSSYKAASSGGGLITYYGGTGKGSSDTNSVTTDSWDSGSGSNFIVGCVAYLAGTQPTISDNKGNTANYLSLTVQTGINSYLFIFYCPSATCGTGHMVTATGTGIYPSIVVASFANVKATSPFDAQNGTTANGVTSVQPGSVSPANDNELLIAAFSGYLLNETISISGTGWVKTTQVNSDGATHVAAALGYHIQTTKGADNPTFSWSTASVCSAAQGAFLNT